MNGSFVAAGARQTAMFTDRNSPTGRGRSGHEEEPADDAFWSHARVVQVIRWQAFIDRDRRKKEMNRQRNPKQCCPAAHAPCLMLPPLEQLSKDTASR